MTHLRLPRVRRLWLVTSLIFLLAAWQQPTKRAICLSLGVFFGIVAAQQKPGAGS